jgi:hypothetical protein
MTTVDRVARAIRQNPEGLLLLGAGVALMLRHASSAKNAQPQRKRHKRAVSDSYYDSAEETAGDVAAASEGLASKVAAAADDVRGYVSETAQDLTDKASEFGQAASRRTREVADTAYQSTREAADSAYRSVESAIEAHPVSIAVAGLAAGCLAAAVFPSTRFERDTLGPIGRRAADAASETGELVKSAAVARMTKAAMKAGEQLKDAVVERKLSTDNIGEVARDVATDFTNNLTGGGESKTGGRQPDNRQADTRSAKAQL